MKKDEIAAALKTGVYVMYSGAKYKLLDIILFYSERDKQLKYSAELEDKNGRTIVRAPIEFIEIVKGAK